MSATALSSLLFSLNAFAFGKDAETATLPEAQKMNSDNEPKSLYHSLYGNENPLGMSPKAREVLKNSLITENISYDFHDKTAAGLFSRLAKLHQLNQTLIKITPGSRYAIELLFRQLRDTHKTLVYSHHEYEKAQLLGNSLNFNIVKVPENENLGVSLGKMNSADSVIYLSNPHLPFGGFYSKAELSAFIQSCPASSHIIVDECYIHYAGENYEDNSCVALVPKYKNLSVLRSFSKAYGMSGLRLGYYINQDRSPKETLNNLNHTVCALTLQAGLASLDDQEHIEKTISHNKAMLTVVKKFADDHRLVLNNPRANYVCFFLSPRFDMKKTNPLLLQYGIRKNRVGTKAYFKISLKSELQIVKFLSQLKECLNK